MTPSSSRSSRRAQQGITMVGLLFWSVLIVFAAVLLIKTVPAYVEFESVKTLVNQTAVKGGNTVPEIKANFERMRSNQGTIDSMNSGNLDITKDNDRIVINFAYDKEIPLFGPVSLLLKFRGRSQ
ncbi:MAG: DUF4845 domain-containing protein [Leptothrix ochracea]|uniref:DUF4845 domain-containing protein n=1 Tax=Leptothrix ochracea TaxID=735331 RepID=UPI0034E2641A